MMQNKEYDVAIIGGGLAGLAAAILLRRQGFAVILLEKESYPRHKVCGEYISLESFAFLERLGLPLATMKLPIIKKLVLTSPAGNAFTTTLPLGGFGISRYRLDAALAAIAIKEGVTLLQNTRVDDVQQSNNGHAIFFNQQSIEAKLCLGTWGKRSSMDIKWNRFFLSRQNTRLNNYVGIKYHVKTAWPADAIGLHNFKNGYCGISKIEGDLYCLCYMTRAENLKASGGSIARMEETILHQNPALKDILINSEVQPGFPVTISQISFSRKEKTQHGVLLLGDAAGMITPLCGNGMSIALHTGKLAAEAGTLFLQGKIAQRQMERQYTIGWKQAFAKRITAGRALQYFFGSKALSNAFVSTFKAAPVLAKPLIRLTHGAPF